MLSLQNKLIVLINVDFHKEIKEQRYQKIKRIVNINNNKKDSHLKKKHDFNIYKTDFPEITIDKFPVHIMEGNNATIVCSARGNPVPKVQWFQQDHNITEFQMNQSVLHLFNVDRLLDGILYSCKAMSSSNRFDSLTSENTTKAIVYCKYISKFYIK